MENTMTKDDTLRIENINIILQCLHAKGGWGGGGGVVLIDEECLK